METMHISLLTRTSLLLLVSVGLTTGCGGSEKAPSTPAATTEAAPGPAQPGMGPASPGSYEPDPAVLAAADAQDGTVDKVVGNCAVCSLAMPGEATESVALGEYELHMCSSLCTETFEADIPGSVDRLAAALSEGEN